jgi:hypothetical protein
MKEVKMIRGGKFILYCKVSHPTLTVYLSDQKTVTDTAVIICPGDGYKVNVYLQEGTIILQVLHKLFGGKVLLHLY